MKTFLLSIYIILSVYSFAQIENGYNKTEVKDMIALCNSFTFLELYDADTDIIPPQYKKEYASGIYGMDNKYQIYIKDKTAVINLRGSTDQKISWLENIYFAMIPAKGVISISGDKFNYCFASDPNAAVHAGYALGIAYMHNDIVYHINTLNKDGIYNFIITGHSQGGALANMLRAYLENLPPDQISKKNKYKTYAFAPPMVGNKVFASEYNVRYCVNNSSFNIINPADPVPDLPLSYNDTNYVEANLKKVLFNREAFNIKDLVTDGAANILESKIIKIASILGVSTSGQIANDLGQVVLPHYTNDVNYHRLNNQVDIQTAVFPKVLKDSTILKNDSLMRIYKKGTDGYFLNKDLYIKEPWVYQHKPYNYYVTILKMYFPAEYKTLKRKYLPENVIKEPTSTISKLGKIIGTGLAPAKH
jgi:triacylglycerol lipase